MFEFDELIVNNFITYHIISTTLPMQLERLFHRSTLSSEPARVSKMMKSIISSLVK